MFMKRTQFNYRFRPDAPLTKVMQVLRKAKFTYHVMESVTQIPCKTKFKNTLKRLVK